MDYKLSDLTLAAWILILTFLPISVGGALVWGQVQLWLFGEQEMEVPGLILAMPGLAYFGLYWAFCQWRGIRLVKPDRGYDSPPVPWRALGIIVASVVLALVLLFSILVINRLLNPIE